MNMLVIIRLTNDPESYDFPPGYVKPGHLVTTVLIRLLCDLNELLAITRFNFLAHFYVMLFSNPLSALMSEVEKKVKHIFW